MGDAPIYARWLCQQVVLCDPLERGRAQRQAVEMVARLPDLVFAGEFRGIAKDLEITQGQLKDMVRAVQNADKAKAKGAIKIELEQPNGFLEGYLFEMIYDANHEDGPRTAFVIRDPDGKIQTRRAFDTESYRVTPFPPMNSLIRNRVIRLPSKLGKYESEVALQEEIQTFIRKYVDLPNHIERLASYYVMMTWLYDAFYVVPYLRARGDSDSGKSRFTEVVGELCFRSIFVTGSTTPSPVFRLMERWNGMTVIMDEADLPHTDTSADWIQMLNTGYKKGFSILRTAMVAGEAVVESFNAFGPKVLNMRGKFTDDATESRCLTWETASGRGIRHDIPRYMDRDVFLNEAQEIRNKLLAFRLKTWSTIEVDYNHEATKNVPGRLVEITVPLMSISNDAEFKGNVMSFIRRMNERAIMDRQATLEAKVVEAIMRCMYLPDLKILELPEKYQVELSLQVAHITRQTNRIINRENAEASLGDDGEYKAPKEMSTSYVGKIIGNKLNLETRRSTIGTRAKVIKQDDEFRNRLNALVIRYGMEDLWLELIAKGEEERLKRMGSKSAEQKRMNI